MNETKTINYDLYFEYTDEMKMSLKTSQKFASIGDSWHVII